MIMTEIIAKKRDGNQLSKSEIKYFVNGLVNGTIPDYQASALLMAMYLCKINFDEIIWLTEAMMNSGDKVDLSPIEGIKVDKHSTGGVADTTSIILVPLVGSAGAKIAKMSGRGLGHTGGTIDKLESIPGMKVDFTPKELIKLVQETGIAIIEQTKRLVPADKMIYALRDVTATTSNIGLIASSIMSKKLAAGADKFLLDVKTGSGAFITNWDEGVKLAETMVKIGESFGKETIAILTSMDQPLGSRIGNALEIKEAVRVLSGEAKGDLRNICLYLGADLLVMAGLAENQNTAKQILTKCINTGAALNKFNQMIKAQGGDSRIFDNFDLLPQANSRSLIRARHDGYITHIDTGALGQLLVNLGIGRKTKGEAIDHGVGMILHRRCGDEVAKGDVIGEILARDNETAEDFANKSLENFKIGQDEPFCPPLIRARIDREGFNIVE